MEKSFNKSENIRKAIEVYKNNPKFTIRSAATIYYYISQLITNRLTEKYRSVSDIYIFFQRLISIEEYVLIVYIS
jgi:DNA integrity scanning protein DisA with diadenylate cyclase activity